MWMRLIVLKSIIGNQNKVVSTTRIEHIIYVRLYIVIHNVRLKVGKNLINGISSQYIYNSVNFDTQRNLRRLA